MLCAVNGRSAPREQSVLGSRSQKTVAVLAVCAAALLGYYAWYSIGSDGGAERYPISWFIIIVALVGSLVNEPFRTDKANVTPGHGLFTYSVWKGAVAVVFAFLLYLLFMSGLVSGDVFPAFSHINSGNGGDYVSMEDFLVKVKPASYKDVAKVLVWSFIAGYSERFVPNLISRVIDSGAGERPQQKPDTHHPG